MGAEAGASPPLLWASSRRRGGDGPGEWGTCVAQLFGCRDLPGGAGDGKLL